MACSISVASTGAFAMHSLLCYDANCLQPVAEEGYIQDLEDMLLFCTLWPCQARLILKMQHTVRMY